VGGKQATGAIAAREDFEAVFREHFAPVHRFIARRVGKALAEDLAAEVFADSVPAAGRVPARARVTAVLAVRDRHQRSARALAGRAAAT